MTRISSVHILAAGHTDSVAPGLSGDGINPLAAGTNTAALAIMARSQAISTAVLIQSAGPNEFDTPVLRHVHIVSVQHEELLNSGLPNLLPSKMK